MPFLKVIFIQFVLVIDRMMAPPPQKKSGMVLIRMDAIGDFVVWSHTAAGYQEQYKSEKRFVISGPAIPMLHSV